MSDKAYVVVNGLVQGPNCAPFRVHDEFPEIDLCEMLNECHDYAMRIANDRIHEVCLERENARTERNCERQRRRDDEGVWIATRDANKELTVRVKRTEMFLKRMVHWSKQFVLAIEGQFGEQKKYGKGIVGNLWRGAEEAERYMDKYGGTTQRPNDDEPMIQDTNDANNPQRTP